MAKGKGGNVHDEIRDCFIKGYFRAVTDSDVSSEGLRVLRQMAYQAGYQKGESDFSQSGISQSELRANQFIKQLQQPLSLLAATEPGEM